MMNDLLFNVNLEEKENPVPKNFEDFLYNIFYKKAFIGKLPREPSEDEMCFLCSTAGKVDVVRISRSCKCSNNPCEGHECGCFREDQNYQACSECLANCLWKHTAEGLKLQGKYRSKCPFCKAVSVRFRIP
jgi:hypothetical protein